MNHPFYRWHPNLALRYLPMVKVIKAMPHHKVLEVGSGGLGIAPYLREPMTGVDISFEPPLHPLLTPIKGSALKLPFPDNHFDVVVNSDMLEHLAAQDRQQAINEMMRVCTKLLIIGVPCGEQAHEQDKQLDELYQQMHGHRHQFLEEQVGYGLPEPAEIEAHIKQAAQKYKKGISLTTIPNMNLKLRLWLMKGWIAKDLLTNIFFRKVLLFAIPIMRLFNQEPVYRQISVVEIN